MPRSIPQTLSRIKRDFLSFELLQRLPSDIPGFIQQVQLLLMFFQLQTLRLYAGNAFAAFSNSFFQTSLDFLLIMKAHLEFVHGRLERIETLTEHRNVKKRFKEILGNARLRIKRPGQPTLSNPDQLPKE